METSISDDQKQPSYYLYSIHPATRFSPLTYRKGSRGEGSPSIVNPLKDARILLP